MPPHSGGMILSPRRRGMRRLSRDTCRPCPVDTSVQGSCPHVGYVRRSPGSRKVSLQVPFTFIYFAMKKRINGPTTLENRVSGLLKLNMYISSYSQLLPS